MQIVSNSTVHEVSRVNKKYKMLKCKFSGGISQENVSTSKSHNELR